jgi:hypothetical protein
MSDAIARYARVFAAERRVVDGERRVLALAEQAFRFEPPAPADIAALREAVRELEVLRQYVARAADPSTRTGIGSCVACGGPTWVDSNGGGYFTCRRGALGENCREP